MANWLKILRLFEKLLSTIRTVVSMMNYSFPPKKTKPSYHSFTGWNSQRAFQLQPAWAAGGSYILKIHSLCISLTEAWLNKHLEQAYIIWSQVKNIYFLPKNSAGFFSAFFDFRFESPLCSLENHHMKTWIMQHSDAAKAHGTAQGLELKGMGTLT